MNDWKEAYRLAAFELKASMKSFLLILAFYTAMSLIVMMSFDIYLKGDFRYFDLLYLLIFFLFPAWMKNKEFQMQKLSGDLWTVPSVVMLQQLPISKEAIIKSRFIIHAVCSFPLQLVLLIAMPIMSEEFRNYMTPVTYPVFVLIWLSLAIAIGFIMAASEVGGNFKKKAIVMSFIYVLGGTAAVFFLVAVIANDGFILLTMQLAGDWPFLSGIIAIVLGIAGWKYWQWDMKKMMKKTDYL